MKKTVDMTQSAGALMASALWRRIMGIDVFYTAATILATIALFGFGVDFSAYQRLLMLGIGAPVVGLTLFAVNLLILKAQFRPIRAFFEAADNGQLTPDLTKRALTRALNFPLLTVVRVMTMHGPTGVTTITLLVLLFLNPVMNAGFQTSQIILLWATLFTVIPAHAIFEYFAVLGAVRPVIPAMQRHAVELAADDRRRIVRLGIRRKLLFLSVFITLVPLVVLAYSSSVKFANLLSDLGLSDAIVLMAPLFVWMVLLIAFCILATIGMSLLMAREVGSLTGALVQAMQRIAGGELATRLAVTSTDEYADLYEGFNRMAGGLQERERLRDAFGRYITPALAEDVMRHGVSLGGQTVSATVLFADMRGFTALSERLTPAEVVALLNGYFAVVEPVIQGEGGWINKFGGDSLLAVFGAPQSQHDHAQRAVRAALGMRSAIAQFNTSQQAAGRPTIRIGIGVHTGEMIAGNVGSPARMEYTVIGDIVNVASRIEALNKTWDTGILVSAEVFAALGGTVQARAMPAADVEGRSTPLHVYALE